jgi:tetratricopeptide (TPR) repeat protein
MTVALTASGQAPPTDNPELVQAVQQLAEGKYKEAIDVLQRLMVGSPSEPVYFHLGSAYLLAKDYRKAAAAFADGASKFPLSARLNNGAGLAYEQMLDLGPAVTHYRRANALDPTIIYTGGGRYDPEFDAIYIPVVHDHRGVNSCSGRLYVNDQKIHFVVYIVVSGYGPGNDDSFEAPYTQISEVEVDRKKGAQWVDYYIITLLTNLSGPRRRLATGEQSRVDLKFTFKQPIKGYRGNPWTKDDIKFFFIEPELGERFVKYLEGKDLKITLRSGGPVK